MAESFIPMSRNRRTDRLHNRGQAGENAGEEKEQADASPSPIAQDEASGTRAAGADAGGLDEPLRNSRSKMIVVLDVVRLALLLVPSYCAVTAVILIRGVAVPPPFNMSIPSSCGIGINALAIIILCTIIKKMLANRSEF